MRTPPLSVSARIETGVLLRRLQQGESLGPPHSRPMQSIAARCHELRIVDDHATWRVIYRIDQDAVVIVEVFAKKTRTTPGYVIENCRRRLKAYDSVEEDRE